MGHSDVKPLRFIPMSWTKALTKSPHPSISPWGWINDVHLSGTRQSAPDAVRSPLGSRCPVFSVQTASVPICGICGQSFVGKRRRRPAHHSPFTIHHSPFTIHYSLFTIHHSLFTIHYSPFTIHHSLFAIRYSLFTIHYSLFTIRYSLFTIRYSLFAIHYSLFAIRYSLFTIHYSLFTIRYSLFAIRYSLFAIHYSLFTIRYSLFTRFIRVRVGRGRPTHLTKYNYTSCSDGIWALRPRKACAGWDCTVMKCRMRHGNRQNDIIAEG